MSISLPKTIKEARQLSSARLLIMIPLVLGFLVIHLPKTQTAIISLFNHLNDRISASTTNTKGFSNLIGKVKNLRKAVIICLPCQDLSHSLLAVSLNFFSFTALSTPLFFFSLYVLSTVHIV